MARVTVEDCVKIVNNRFELVVLASKRAKAISSGAPLTLKESKHNKHPVNALREIAEETINIDHLRESVMNGLGHNQGFEKLDEMDQISRDVDSIEIESEINSYTNVRDSKDEFDDGFSFGDENLDVDD